LNQLETGTQGSIDGYMISFYLGIVFVIGIILVQIFFKKYYEEKSKFIFIFLLIFNILLYVINFSFLYNVTIIGYSINDVLTNAIEYGFAEIDNTNDVERIFPVLFYLMITINVAVCLINIKRKKKC
jgi:hypothetical protein